MKPIYGRSAFGQPGNTSKADPDGKYAPKYRAKRAALLAMCDSCTKPYEACKGNCKLEV